jgi:hypothetical protein
VHCRHALESVRKPSQHSRIETHDGTPICDLLDIEIPIIQAAGAFTSVSSSPP